MRTPARNLIVNADDFGATCGINQGIVHCHKHGVVTSTSLMVRGRAAEEACALAQEHPALAVGLHWDLDSEARGNHVDIGNSSSVRGELERQLEDFHRLMGRPPTHVDSHHHVHRESEVAAITRELVAPVGVPLREEGPVRFVGGFYAQWEWQVTDLEHISPEFFTWILRNEVEEGWTEISCHPGFVTAELASVYLAEREVEVATLTDQRVRKQIEALGIRLASYADLLAESDSP